MADLGTVARQLLVLTVAHWGLLLLLGSGVLMPPDQLQRSFLMRPSYCVAPPEVYHKVGVHDFFFSSAAVGAVALAGFVACHHQVAAPGAGGAGAATKAMLRALTVTAAIFSATAAGIAMASSYLILQAKAGTFACIDGSVRVAVYASYFVIGPILLVCYLDLARMALLSE